MGSGILLDLALQHGDHLVLRFLTFQPNLILGNGVWKEVEERKAVGERKATGTWWRLLCCLARLLFSKVGTVSGHLCRLTMGKEFVLLAFLIRVL